MLERYDYPPIAKIWSDNNRYLLWTKIELAFLEAFTSGDNTISIPCPDIFYSAWIKKIQEKERVTKHDVAAFVEWMEEDFLFPLIRERSRFVHYGLTSSDILDTCFSMQIRESNEIIRKLVQDASNMFGELALKYRTYNILGRTHGQAAEVIKLSEKFYSYTKALSAFSSFANTYYGRLAGSVGSYQYISTQIEAQVLNFLELKPCPTNDGQIINRSVYARYMNEWAVLGSIIEKIALDIRILAQTEIGEILEGFSKDQVGSSSMSHKRNPILCENLCGLARVIRGYQATAMQNVALFNERDISHSSAERIIFPDAAILLGFMLKRLIGIIESLVVDTDRMKDNIERFGKGTSAQKEMLSLIDGGMTRKEAHALLRNKYRREKKMGRRVNLENQRFGKSVVHSYSHVDHGKTIWNIVCDCGNAYQTTMGNLRSGNTQSCGCYNKQRTSETNRGRTVRENLTGQKFGMITLTTLHTVNQHGCAIWNGVCDCGNVLKILARSVKSGHTVSCGCLKKSKLETFLKKICLKYCFKFEEQYPLPQKFFTINEQKIPLRVDFLLIYKDIHIAIECQGKQHYKPIRWGGEQGLKFQQERDEYKRKILFMLNIPLVEVRYDCYNVEEFLISSLEEAHINFSI